MDNRRYGLPHLSRKTQKVSLRRKAHLSISTSREAATDWSSGKLTDCIVPATATNRPATAVYRLRKAIGNASVDISQVRTLDEFLSAPQSPLFATVSPHCYRPVKQTLREKCISKRLTPVQELDSAENTRTNTPLPALPLHRPKPIVTRKKRSLLSLPEPVFAISTVSSPRNRAKTTR